MKDQDIFFKKNPYPMWVFSQETLKIKAVNEAALDLYGYTENEMLSLTIKDLRPDREIPRLERELRNPGQKLNDAGVWLHHSKSDEHIYLHINSSPIEWDGETCKLVVAQNVTEQKNLEHLLVDDTGFLEVLIQNFPGTFFLFDQNDKLIRWNKNFARFSGYSDTEIDQMPASKFIPASEQEKLGRAIQTTYQEGWVEFDSFLSTKDGGKIPYLFKASKVFIKGEPHLMGIGINIKTMKDAELKLETLYQLERKERARIESINNRLKLIENMSHIFETEEEFHVALDKVAQLLTEEVADTCSINLLKDGKPYRAAYQVASQEILEKATNLYEHYPNALFSVDRFKNVLKEGKPKFTKWITEEELESIAVNDEQFNLLKDLNLKSYFLLPLKIGKRKLGVLSMMIVEGNRSFFADDETFMVELTEKMALHIDNFMYEEDLKAMNQTLEEKVKERTKQLEIANKELESFSYSVSHDLRAPLRAITGYSNFLIEDHIQNLDEEGQEFLHIVHDETRRMGDLIDDLLAFSRMSRTEKQEQVISMKKLVEETIYDLRMKFPDEDPKFSVGNLPEVTADQNLFKQVWVNLLSNAIKYKKTGQQQIIKIDATLNKTESEYVFNISDNGVGFDMKYADKLFGVFQRLHSDDEFEGTGIGLALVQRIIHRHGGRIWAESEINKGSTFYFTLPANNISPKQII